MYLFPCTLSGEWGGGTQETFSSGEQNTPKPCAWLSMENMEYMELEDPSLSSQGFLQCEEQERVDPTFNAYSLLELVSSVRSRSDLGDQDRSCPRKKV